MSRFFSEKYRALVPYVPGEQPERGKFIKLNTNENPYPPSPKAVAAAAAAAQEFQLYSDPDMKQLRQQAAGCFGVEPEELIFTNGSDEILNLAFMAFCDDSCPAIFPDITYGFYPVFAKVNGIPFETRPLEPDFRVNPRDYMGLHRTVFLANPNAPTGLALSLAEIEAILKANPDTVTVIDEAYVDFGGETALPLIHRYDNLLVTRTFSKSRSMAGARLGFGIGCKALVADLNAVRCSVNPYNVNSATLAAGIGVLADEDYTRKNIRRIAETRDSTARALKALGFELTDSKTNFLFVRHPALSGEDYYRLLREAGILVRHFGAPRIGDYNRITVGTPEQMETLVAVSRKILAAVPDRRLQP